MTEYEAEPIRGLPGHLPPGEQILWQGGPDPWRLARAAFHARGVALYFMLLTAVALGMTIVRSGGLFAMAATIGCGLVAVGLLHLLAWAAARSTVYTLTDRRIVLRIGVALPKCVNLPLARIAAIDLSARGDIALRTTATLPLGWLALWPHARPWRLAHAEPMLRSITDAQAVAARIARACQKAQPEAPPSIETSSPVRPMVEAVAA